MSPQLTLHIRATNEQTVLPRILLIFSRRRLRMNALQMFDRDPVRPAHIQIDLECAPDTARDVVAQLRRIVEVSEVRTETARVVDAALESDLKVA